MNAYVRKIKPSEVHKAAEVIAFWHRVRVDLLFQSKVKVPEITVARHDILRSLCAPEVSIASVARAINMHPSAALYALGRLSSKKPGSRAKPKVAA